MPRLGGLDAIKRIRAFDRAIKVVVMTGAPDPELQRQARALGAVAVLAKPIALPSLLEALRAETVVVPAAERPAPPPGAPRPPPGATPPPGLHVVGRAGEVTVGAVGPPAAAGDVGCPAAGA